MTPYPVMWWPKTITNISVIAGVRVYGQLSEHQLNKLTRPGVLKAAEYLYAQLRRVLNVPYPPASVPGEAPHRRTGRGRDGLRIWKSSMGTPSAFVYLTGESVRGTKVKYMWHLEKNMNRPWFMSTWNRVRHECFRRMMHPTRK